MHLTLNFSEVQGINFKKQKGANSLLVVQSIVRGVVIKNYKVTIIKEKLGIYVHWKILPDQTGRLCKELDKKRQLKSLKGLPSPLLDYRPTTPDDKSLNFPLAWIVWWDWTFENPVTGKTILRIAASLKAPAAVMKNLLTFTRSFDLQAASTQNCDLSIQNYILKRTVNPFHPDCKLILLFGSLAICF